MDEQIATLQQAAAEQARDEAKLARIAESLTDISEAAASRVTARISQRVERRRSYIGQLVSELRQGRERIQSEADSLQAIIEDERDNIDELRLLRRLDEITREESDQRIAAARAAVQATRDQRRAINDQLQRIDAALADYPEESKA